MPNQRTPDAHDAAATADVTSPRSSRTLTVCGGTDIGTRRRDNQDTFVIADLESGHVSRPCVRTEVTVSRPGLLMLVCDGMGGAAAGDVAARVAAASIKHDLQAAGSAVVRDPGPSLERALAGANQAILDEAEAHPEERGMGTTCTAAVVSPDGLAIAQVGDSRAYLLRDGQLHTLTRDQTMAEKLVDQGVLRPDQVERFPFRHVLAQALGAKPGVEPVITNVQSREGDRVLLCSDGLHGPVSHETITAILTSTPDVSAVAQALIHAALEAGGPDNITVVVADCGPMRQRPGA